MPSRSLRWHGFGITIEVPSVFARARRRLRPQRSAGQLSVRRAPALTRQTRDAEESVAWMREHFSGLGSPAGFDPARYSWYHTIELPGGAQTNGMYDHRPLVPHYGLPEDLRGSKALDVGSANGFWAFELERRGAKVAALDIGTTRDLDLPPRARDIVDRDGLDFPMRRGIEYARRARNSEIELITGSVYDLDPAQVGTFDFVHAGDLLLHLRDPSLALQRIRSVTSGHALLSDVFDPTLDAALGPGLTRYCGGWSVTTWWQPALSTLVQMVLDAGFSEVEVLATYKLRTRGSDQGPWRAVMRARP